MTLNVKEEARIEQKFASAHYHHYHLASDSIEHCWFELIARYTLELSIIIANAIVARPWNHTPQFDLYTSYTTLGLRPSVEELS